ncbi:MAG: DNA polymerase III subunit gamma/tau [Parcubacteria group bacterium Gr01-1014_33]|nr:MAG: DNA polymerase III subunit gamma/tau [Parcubacteria group bacterium Gr01-1014_33]
MSELVLYRKHRPQDFSSVVGQAHVVRAIQNALKLNRVAHAYLFSGPRGVGKTTIARLIAKSLNCAGAGGEKPCNTCAMCIDFNEGRALDIIEIDAASNRGIDEIRALRDAVRFVPTQGQYKTYIIDEVHMLTRDAFNALLKTLEEPPAHAVFILATTELEKVPATIISRTQHYNFRRPSAGQIAERLQSIAKKDNVLLDPDGARVIAFAAEGSFRDGESILGQVMAVEDKKITREEVENILGLPRREAAKKMFGHIAKKEVSAALRLIQELHDSGYDLAYFSKLLLQYFRSALFLKTDPGLRRFVESDMLPDEYECVTTHISAFTEDQLSRAMDIIFQNMQSFKKTPIPQLPLELTVIELIHQKGQEPDHQERV